MTPEYKAWDNILQRCLNPNNPDFANYGGRGIGVCKRWRKFENFLADVGPRPSPQHSIERRNNEKGYQKKNVYWATWQEQHRNKRNNRWITLAGETRIMSDWARAAGLCPMTLSRRLRSGWPVERAIYTPVHHRSGATA